MAIGRKTGGRKKGSSNRKTLEMSDVLASMEGYNPILAMKRIATNPKASLELQGKMNAELAQYILPKRKAVEHTGSTGGGITVVVRSVLQPAEEVQT